MTWTECGNGLMGPILTSHTGCLVSLMEGLSMTTESWTVSIPVLGSGAFCTSPTIMITFVSLPCEYLVIDSVITIKVEILHICIQYLLRNICVSFEDKDAAS